MPQILNTGAGLYQPVQQSSYDPIQVIKDAGESYSKIMEYDYNIRKQREQDFLKSIDVKTENMLYATLQKEAAKKLEEFKSFAIDEWRNAKGKDLTMDQKLRIASKKREYESWQADRLSAAEKLIKTKEIVYNNPSLFDMDETQSKITEAENNILTKTVDKPTMRYKTVDERFDEAYKLYGWKTESETRDYEKDGVNYTGEVVRVRRGLETDEKRFQKAMELYDNDYELQRTIDNDYTKLLKQDKEEASKYKSARDFYAKTHAINFGQPDIITKGVSGKKDRKSVWNLFTNTTSGNFAISAVEDWKNPLNKNMPEKAIDVKKRGGIGGMWIRSSGDLVDEKGEQVNIQSGEVLELENITSNEAIGTIYRGATEIDREATDNINRQDPNYLENKKEGEKVDFFDANIEVRLAQRLNGEGARTIVKGYDSNGNEILMISKPLTSRGKVKIPFNVGKNLQNFKNKFVSNLKGEGTEDAWNQIEKFLGGFNTRTTSQSSTSIQSESKKELTPMEKMNVLKGLNPDGTKKN